jgi:hypothetical protein
VAAVWANDQVAVAFHDTVPGAPFGVLHLLHYRGVRRGLVDGDGISRKGTGVLTRQRSGAGGQARGE